MFNPKCVEKLNKEKISNLILNTNKIKDSINEIESQLDLIIKNDSFKSLNIQLKSINKTLFMIMENINENNEFIFKLLNIKNSNNISMINNDLNNENSKKALSDNNIINLVNNEKIKSILSKKVKSDYIIKIVFSYLNEKNKLSIIKYNKNLQNKISIKLINYKLYSGIYIEYESKTKVKEYYGDTGNTIYDIVIFLILSLVIQ